MSTSTAERLWEAYVNDGDYDGANQLSAAEQLRVNAQAYLDGAVESGEVNKSRLIHISELGVCAGYTEVETASGVEILRWSDGGFGITAKYDEQPLGANVGDYQDLTVTVELPVVGEPVVTEDRRRVVDYEPTLDGGSRTLSYKDRARVMAELAREIFVIYT